MPTKSKKAANKVQVPMLSKDHQEMMSRFVYINNYAFSKTVGSGATYVDNKILGLLRKTDDQGVGIRIYYIQRDVTHGSHSYTNTYYLLYIERFNMLFTAYDIDDLLEYFTAMDEWFKLEKYEAAIRDAEDLAYNAQKAIEEGSSSIEKSKKELSEAEALKGKLAVPKIAA